MHMVKQRFERTGEDTFERIFHRPLGKRCFLEFVNHPATNDVNPSWLLAMQFLKDTEEMKSEQPAAAFEQATSIISTYFESPILSSGASDLWAAPALKAKLEERMSKLKEKAELSAGTDATMSKKKNLNLKEFFSPYIMAAKAFLATAPFDSFKASTFWVRYMQWKQLELNMIVNERDFDVHRILGRGGFGEVFGCRKFDTGALFAMKKLDKKRLKLKSQESTAVHERNVLSEMHSKFVTKLKYSFHDKDSLYLLLDLCEGGDLNWHLNELGTFSEEQAKFYTAQIVMGLAHIHDKEMVYRDLKPANVLLNGEGNAMISDMGLVRVIKKGRSLPKSECGTHGYMAPEVLTKDLEYSYPSDWFSLGCTLYQFFAGYTPFKGPKKTAGAGAGGGSKGGKSKSKSSEEERRPSRDEVTKRTMAGVFEFPDNVPAPARDLISKLLQADPVKRIGSKPPPHGAQEIRAHPWFADIDWQALADHKVEPLIVPHHGTVNASDVHEIERFDRDDTRRIKITLADEQKYYSKFDYIMSHSWQDEVMVMFDLVTKNTDVREEKERIYATRLKATGKGRAVAEVDGAGQGASSSSVCIMEGFWLKQSKILKSWNLRYMRLYPDRLTLANDTAAKVKATIYLKDVLLEDQELPGPSASKPLIELAIKSKGDGGAVLAVIRVAYLSDQPIWIELLEAALDAAGGTRRSTIQPVTGSGGGGGAAEAGAGAGAAAERVPAASEVKPHTVQRQQSIMVGDHLSAAEKSRALDRLGSEEAADIDGGGEAVPTIHEGGEE